MKAPLSRRTVLRGMSATLALPFLDAMTPLSALARTGRFSRAPLRSVFVGLGGGVWAGEDGFFPWKSAMDVERAKVWGKKGVLPGGALADTGRQWKLTNTLEPLANVRDQITLLSGLHNPNDSIRNPVVNAHGQDLGTLLTATDISGTQGVALKNGVSFDQVLARKIGHQTRIPSLALTVGRSSYNNREATGLGYMGFLSYDFNGNAVPTEGDPQRLFDRLFTDGSEEDQAQREQRRRRKASILDAVKDDLHQLNGMVGHDDRQRLDEYFTTVREVEQRAERAKQWDDIPINLPEDAERPEKVDRGAYGKTGEGRVEEMRQMLDVLTLALQTDMTRVASLRLGGYHGQFAFLGFPEDPHGNYAHNNGDPKKVAGARAIDRMHMEQFAYFLEKMASIQETDGSLLDNSLVMYGAGLTNGPKPQVRGDEIGYNAHGQANAPLLLAGKAGGRLQAGEHVNYDHGTPLSNLFVTMAGLNGLSDFQFVDSTGPLNGLAVS